MVLPPVLACLTISQYFKSPLLIATTPFPAPLKQHWDGSFIFLCIFVSLSSSSSYTSIYTILPYTLCTTSLQVPKGCCEVGLKKSVMQSFDVLDFVQKYILVFCCLEETDWLNVMISGLHIEHLVVIDRRQPTSDSFSSTFCTFSFPFSYHESKR